MSAIDYIPKGDVADVVSGFVVVSGVILTAISMPASEIIIGAGLGYLFKSGISQLAGKLK